MTMKFSEVIPGSYSEETEVWIDIAEGINDWGSRRRILDGDEMPSLDYPVRHHRYIESSSVTARETPGTMVSA